MSNKRATLPSSAALVVPAFPSEPLADPATDDPWTWAVEYSDGAILYEYDQRNPVGYGFQQALRVRGKTVVRLILIPNPRVAAPGAPLSTCALMAPRPRSRARLVFVRRRQLVLDPDGQTTQRLPAMTIIGLETGSAAAHHGVYTILFADGSCVVTDNFNLI